MKIIHPLANLCPFFSGFAFSQWWKVFDNLSMPSKILKMDRKYTVIYRPTMKPHNAAIGFYTCCTVQEMTRAAGFSLEVKILLTSPFRKANAPQ